MKKSFTFLISALLMVLTVQAQDRNTVYPGVTDTSRLYQAPKTATPPVIDGNHTDAAWNIAPWKQAFAISPKDANSWPNDSVPPAPQGAFSGPEDVSFKYKIIWDDNHYYMLMRYTDDELVYSDLHNGYQNGSVPEYMTGVTVPADAGLGDGTSFQSFRMDMIAFWMTAHTDALAGGASYNRANNGLLHNFFPGKITKSTQAGSVLWAARHNPLTTPNTNPNNHRATVAGKYDDVEKAYYIEFRDTTWTGLFSTVRTKLADQKDYATVAPAIGDKFLLQGEINDADGITNRRDYVNYWTHMSLSSVKTPLQNLSEALVVELVDQVSSVKATSAKRNLEFYPNPNNTESLTLSRIADVEIFNMAGQRVIQSLNTSEVNISGLQPGIYMVKDKEGNVGKLVRK